MKKFVSATSVLLVALVTAGCGSNPAPQTGFLKDYSSLKDDKDGAMRFVSPKLKDYNAFILEPVQVQAQSKLNEKERAEVAEYFNQALAKELTKRGYSVTSRSGPGVARVRVAVTDIQESKWYLNLHPASKVTGVGTGGASMEGEVIDSNTGEQLGAVVQAGRGSQFELDTFSKLDDVKDAINKWAENAGKRLDELRQGA